MQDTIHPVDRHVGARMASRRIELGMNQSELGRALGLSFQQVQKYEKGTNRVSASKLWDASKPLGVSVAYFFEGLEDVAQAPEGESAYTRRLRYIQTAPGAAAVDALLNLGDAFARVCAQLGETVRKAQAGV